MSDKDGPKQKGARRHQVLGDITWCVPKRAGARHDNPDDWDRYGPNEPLPEAVRARMMEALAPHLFRRMEQLGLPVEVFDEETWGPFLQAFIPCYFGVADDEEKDALVRVVRRAFEKKLGRPLDELDRERPRRAGPTGPEALALGPVEARRRGGAAVGPASPGALCGPVAW